MPELTDREKRLLKKLKSAAAAADAIPAQEKRPISNPDKYAFPIGLDDNGNKLPDKPANYRIRKNWPKG